MRAKRIKVPEISIEFHLIHSKFQRVGIYKQSCELKGPASGDTVRPYQRAMLLAIFLVCFFLFCPVVVVAVV